MTKNLNLRFSELSGIMSTCSFPTMGMYKRNLSNNCCNYREKYAEINGDYENLYNCSLTTSPFQWYLEMASVRELSTPNMWAQKCDILALSL